jgi:hypothetical protein
VTIESERRCRRPPTTRREGDLRPTDVVGSFFICGIAFLLAAAVAALIQAAAPWAWGRWLALHLAFVGGVSQLVLGASQFFAGAFLATDPPPRRLVRAELAAWNLGAVILAIAIPRAAGSAVWLAVGLLMVALALWGSRSRRCGGAPCVGRHGRSPGTQAAPSSSASG